MKSTSTWFALRNPVFFRLFLASVLSGTVVSAQDMAATWVIHDVGASAFSLSLMATAASAPYFLFTLPAGVLADIVDRRLVIVSAVLWQGACAALLALGAWTQVINSNSLLACIFALGIGLALGAPVWGAIVPDIVSKDELSSAVTLGGVQLNVSTILGPEPDSPCQRQSIGLRENFTESFISSLRYAHNSQRMKIMLFRNILFSLVISIVPALLPVIALKELECSAAQLGLVFMCLVVGS